MATSTLIPIERIENRIYLIRGEKVMVDAELAELYGVPTKRLNEQVKRNYKRFPEDFMFRLTKQEAEALKSHVATLKSGRGEHRKYLPLAFTERGVRVGRGGVRIAELHTKTLCRQQSVISIKAVVSGLGVCSPD